MDSPFEYGDFLPSIHRSFHKCYQWWLYLLITHKRKWWWPSPLLPPVCPAPEGFGRWDPCNSASLRLCPSRSLLPRPGIKVILLYRVRFWYIWGFLSVQALYGEENALYWKKSSNGKIPHPCPIKVHKTALDMLPKKHWVIALFEIVRFVTKKILLTVLLDHPVLWCQLNRLSKCLYCFVP